MGKRNPVRVQAVQLPAADDSGEGLAEIIVTPRRGEGSLEHVPQTVDAVTADTIQRLNILKLRSVMHTYTFIGSGFR